MSRDHLGQFNVAEGMLYSRGVLLLDDCSGTFNWTVTGTGSDFAASYATAAAFAGLKGVSMATKTTTPALNDYVKVVRYIPYPESNLIVYRMRLCMPDISDIGIVQMFLYLWNGTRKYVPAIQFDPNGPQMDYYNSSGGWTEITEHAMAMVDGIWTIIELALDKATKEYVSCTFNGVKKDLSGVGLFDDSASSVVALQAAITVKAAGANVATGYFDQIYCGEYLEL